jgi:hypothetical protein
MTVTSFTEPDGPLNKTARIKIRHYRQIYTDRNDPIVFLPVDVFRFLRALHQLILKTL